MKARYSLIGLVGLLVIAVLILTPKRVVRADWYADATAAKATCAMVKESMLTAQNDAAGAVARATALGEYAASVNTSGLNTMQLTQFNSAVAQFDTAMETANDDYGGGDSWVEIGLGFEATAFTEYEENDWQDAYYDYGHATTGYTSANTGYTLSKLYANSAYTVLNNTLISLGLK